MCRDVAVNALGVVAAAFELGPDRQDAGAFEGLARFIEAAVAGAAVGWLLVMVLLMMMVMIIVMTMSLLVLLVVVMFHCQWRTLQNVRRHVH